MDSDKTTSTTAKIFEDLQEWLDEKRAEAPTYHFNTDEDEDSGDES